MRSAVLLVVLGVAAYANGLAAPFVFDDLHAIVENPHVRHLWPATKAMTAPPQSALSGRPLASLSFAITYAIGGLAPSAYRVGNLAIHIGAGLLLFAIVRRRLPESAAFAAAALWITHPLQTEAVDYVTQRTESLMGLLFFATLYAAVTRRHAAAIVACALGMASKESMVTAPLMVIAYDAAFEARSVTRALAARPRFYAGLASTWIVLVALNASGPRSHTAGFSTNVTPWTYLLNQAAMIGTYVRLSLWPHPLILDYGPVQPIALSAVWLPLLLVVALLALTAVAWTRWTGLAFLGTWFFVTLAPSSSIVPIATEVGAERRMYLPLAALIVLAVVAVRAVSKPVRVAAPALAIAATVACVMVTVQRNAEYGRPVELWRAVVERRPHGRAHHSLGFALQQAGRRSEAMAEYRLARAEYPMAHYNLGLLLAAEGQKGEAIVELRERLRKESTDVDARGALADLLLAEQRFAEAAVEYGAYLERAPFNAAAHNNLGLALIKQDRVYDAIREFRTALALAPGDSGASHNLARALALKPGPRA